MRSLMHPMRLLALLTFLLGTVSAVAAQTAEESVALIATGMEDGATDGSRSVRQLREAPAIFTVNSKRGELGTVITVFKKTNCIYDIGIDFVLPVKSETIHTHQAIQLNFQNIKAIFKPPGSTALTITGENYCTGNSWCNGLQLIVDVDAAKYKERYDRFRRLICPVQATEGALSEHLLHMGAWGLGDDLSLAGLFYAQGNQPALFEELMSKSMHIASAMGVTIKPFPPKADNQGTTMAYIMGYFVHDDESGMIHQLSQKCGKVCVALFEVSAKSNLLLKLYGPDEDLGKAIGTVIKTRFEEIGIPRELWGGLVDAIAARKTDAEVRKLVFQMHAAVKDYLDHKKD